MTTADADLPRPADPSTGSPSRGDAWEPAAPRLSASSSTEAMPVVRGCPFLVAEPGGWRLDMPAREHRCAAFAPASALSVEKQQRLCLTPAHLTCATYEASIAARTERLGAAPVRRATRWGLARTTSVIEDSGGIRGRLVAALLDRRRWPAVPAVLLVATLITVALSGIRGVPANSIASASPSAGDASRAPTRTAAPTPRPTPEATTEPSPSPTAAPTATPKPTAKPSPSPSPSASFQTYRVRAGDTLGAIASRFGTTVKAIAELNGITDPSRLQIGQVLLIP